MKKLLIMSLLILGSTGFAGGESGYFCSRGGLACKIINGSPSSKCGGNSGLNNTQKPITYLGYNQR